MVRERDILNKNLLKAAGATQKQLNLVRLHEQAKKNLEQEIQVCFFTIFVFNHKIIIMFSVTLNIFIIPVYRITKMKHKNKEKLFTSWRKNVTGILMKQAI